MQVLCSEGVATHTGPEPCVRVREGTGEASAGERIGQPLSRERNLIPGADAVVRTEGNTSGAPSRAFGRPGVVKETGMCGSSLYGNREIPRLAAIRGGPHREGEEP